MRTSWVLDAEQREGRVLVTFERPGQHVGALPGITSALPFEIIGLEIVGDGLGRWADSARESSLRALEPFDSQVEIVRGLFGIVTVSVSELVIRALGACRARISRDLAPHERIWPTSVMYPERQQGFLRACLHTPLSLEVSWKR